MGGRSFGVGSGLRPDASSQGATVYALLAWQGLFVDISLLMGPFVVLRWLCGLVVSVPRSLDSK
jgi:cytochrome c oxidase subunit I+III